MPVCECFSVFRYCMKARLLSLTLFCRPNTLLTALRVDKGKYFTYRAGGFATSETRLVNNIEPLSIVKYYIYMVLFRLDLFVCLGQF